VYPEYTSVDPEGRVIVKVTETFSTDPSVEQVVPAIASLIEPPIDFVRPPAIDPSTESEIEQLLPSSSRTVALIVPVAVDRLEMMITGSIFDEPAVVLMGIYGI